MAVDFGTDVSTYVGGDLDPTFAVISGRRVVAEAIARRLETRRGALLRDPNYGTDLRAWLNRDFVGSAATLFRLKASVDREAEEDERVLSADATVTYEPAFQKLRIAIAIETAEGPFELVLAVSAVSVAILRPQ
jgi:hypothetical protein